MAEQINVPLPDAKINNGPEQRNLNEAVYDYNERPVDFEEYKNKAGITERMLGRDMEPDRVFRPETNEIFDLMSGIIKDEWVKFQKLLLEMQEICEDKEMVIQRIRDREIPINDRLLFRYFWLKSRSEKRQNYKDLQAGIEDERAILADMEVPIGEETLADENAALAESEENETRNSYVEKVNAAAANSLPYKEEVKAYDELGKTYEKLGIDSGLQSVDALRCLEDVERTKTFIETINKKVQTGDTVLEAGAGTGVLAVVAAMKGAAVEAIEINPVTAAFARRVVDRCERDGLIKPGSVRIRLGDALNYQPRGQDGKIDQNKKFDAYISENIYTGQFYELQVQINNNLLDYVDVSKNKVIPLGLVNGCELTYIKGKIGELEKDTDSFVTREKVDPGEKIGKSQPKLYDIIYLDKKQEVGVRNRFVETMAEDGEIDSITIFSLVQMSSDEGDVIGREKTNFLNNDSTLMLDKTLKASKGDAMLISIEYKAGDPPSEAKVLVHNQRTGETAENIKKKKT